VTAPIPPLAITLIRDTDVEEVIALWRTCDLTRPWNDPRADIAMARREPHAAVLVGRVGDAIVATTMLGNDGHRGWVYYVAVDPNHRGKGYGRVIMHAAENWLHAAGIAKLQLMVRPDNKDVKDFYQSLGYSEQERIIYAKWLDGREPTP
jgi:ribosomal protein S18 acetylase RimI-like enzyme